MSFQPFMWTIFCDDVRQEVGNKLSYLGIYGANLVVPSLPTTLLKLCCVFSVRVPASAPPKSVVFKLLKSDEVLFEAELATSDFRELMAMPAESNNEVRALTIGTIAQLVSVPVTEPCILKARAIVDGKELRGGTLELLAAQPN